MSESKLAEYRVLARKYRPQNFDELIGQDALVRTLKNAIESGRIAHAFMLTGVRGVGKTTTARIIAKALNYAGPDGKSGPTTGPTDDCKICKAIAEDRHPDVMEMDAASRTGVDDIREILDGVRYAPSEARYKIYIIDEVHMLSKNAFNALLKTLEEPPPHVKFIFATTEIRKVPITVLSRCQRFDLRRGDVPTLSEHYLSICEKEQADAEAEAISLIARAADGSVRDGLSILDQAMALSAMEGGRGSITAQQVQDMLGLADRARSMDLLERALSGDMPEALSIMDDLYRSGADPFVLLQDLLDLTHLLTKLRAAPAEKDKNQGMARASVDRAVQLAQEISMPSLGKTWQILLKGMAEVQSAPNPQSAAEMVLIRLAYAADLPDPADLIRRIQTDSGTATTPSAGSTKASGVSAGAGSSVSMDMAVQQPMPPTKGSGPVASLGGGSSAGSSGGSPALAIVARGEPRPHIDLRTLEDIVTLLDQGQEPLLAQQVYHSVHLVKMEEGRLEIRPAPEAPPRLAQDLTQALKTLTDQRWVVSISSAPGQPTIAQQADSVRRQEMAAILELPEIREFLAVFPQAELKAITTIDPQNPTPKT
jgi:DNA polymerase-3 subunit gamma/tau